VLSICPACGWRGFPERIWCPRCGTFDLDRETVVEGVVEDVTTVHRAAGRSLRFSPTRLGTVRVEGTVPVIARLEGTAGGDPVRLATEGGAAIVARHATCNDAPAESSERGRVS
jgi:uncharacterized OB-fold protein